MFELQLHISARRMHSVICDCVSWDAVRVGGESQALHVMTNVYINQPECSGLEQPVRTQDAGDSHMQHIR